MKNIQPQFVPLIALSLLICAIDCISYEFILLNVENVGLWYICIARDKKVNGDAAAHALLNVKEL